MPKKPSLPPSSARPVAPARVSNFSRSTRETIESIAIAFALAFLFKSFQAEAFVIPTGSMAPTLMGRHKDVVCPECGYRYSASGSEEADREGNPLGEPMTVVKCTCPVCRFPMNVDPHDPFAVGRDANPSYSGDRIWVSKVPYHLMEPRRWDVIVFRFPEEAETYYIKRLVGLPNETVKIFHGDIYTKADGEEDFSIQRKPPEKIQAMAQVVHDNDYVSPELLQIGWPLRWQATSGDRASGDWKASEDTRTYQVDGSAENEKWIRYHHLVPSESDWYAIVEDRWSAGKDIRPQLITDFYAFNTRVLRNRTMEPSALGVHWVGDLILDCELDVQSPSGTALLDLVKGGQDFRCAIDVATGAATLTIDGLSDWKRTAETSIRGQGSHRVMFANVDQQLLLWVDNKVVTFDAPTSYPDLASDRPKSTASDPGDLAPVGVGSRGAALKVAHLQVLRDIYYIADSHPMNMITDFRGISSVVPMMRTEELIEFLSTPTYWENQRGESVFDDRQELIFPLEQDQFFVLGDNSPASSDARLWSRQHFVERDLLVGKALFIYWPHPVNLYVPFTNVAIPILPNFSNMGLIR